MGLFKHLLLPPLALFIAIAVGLLIARSRPRLGRAIAGGAGALLVLLSVPFVSAALLISLQSHPELPAEGDLPDAEAILVLGGDYMPMAPELGRSVPGPLSRERLVYTAALHRRSKLPILVTGGRLLPGTPPLAAVLRRSLVEDHRVPVRWVEPSASNTRDNAVLAARIFEDAGVKRVMLVSHAWHMPRALAAFEGTELEVIPAPTGFRLWPSMRVGSFMPSARSIQESFWGIHEWLGRAWYALRY